jgi:hypothetical protein
MATFKIEIQNRRKDNTYNLRIRVTHNRILQRILTHLFKYMTKIASIYLIA